MYILLRDYFKDLKGEDLDKFIWLGHENGKPYRMNEVEAQLNKWLLHDRAKVQVAELEDKIIGFMVYHYFFDSILVVRGIYFIPEYKNRGLLARMIFSIGHVSRVLSQTLTEHEPKEIQGEKKNRLLVYEDETYRVWENVISKGNRRNIKDGL
jgi:hypothetical protein